MMKDNKKSLSIDYDSLKRNSEACAFMAYREGKRIPFRYLLPLAIKALFVEPWMYILRNFPGPIGMQLRQIYYKFKLKHMGKNVLIDEGVRIYGPENIEISDYVLVDKNVVLDAKVGWISIGKRVHISPNCLISGAGGVRIGDYVGLSSSAMVYSHSEAVVDGKRMSGPMVPEEMKGMKTAPVIIEKDAFLGTYAVVLPGVKLGEGAVLGALSIATRDIPAWTIAVGSPAKSVGNRKPVDMEDI